MNSKFVREGKWKETNRNKINSKKSERKIDCNLIKLKPNEIGINEYSRVHDIFNCISASEYQWK